MSHVLRNKSVINNENGWVDLQTEWTQIRTLPELRGGRYTIGRREKSGRKCREEGENEMLWE